MSSNTRGKKRKNSLLGPSTSSSVAASDTFTEPAAATETVPSTVSSSSSSSSSSNIYEKQERTLQALRIVWNHLLLPPLSALLCPEKFAFFVPVQPPFYLSLPPLSPMTATHTEMYDVRFTLEHFHLHANKLQYYQAKQKQLDNLLQRRNPHLLRSFHTPASTTLLPEVLNEQPKNMNPKLWQGLVADELKLKFFQQLASSLDNQLNLVEWVQMELTQRTSFMVEYMDYAVLLHLYLVSELIQLQQGYEQYRRFVLDEHDKRRQQVRLRRTHYNNAPAFLMSRKKKRRLSSSSRLQPPKQHVDDLEGTESDFWDEASLATEPTPASRSPSEESAQMSLDEHGNVLIYQLTHLQQITGHFSFVEYLLASLQGFVDAFEWEYLKRYYDARRRLKCSIEEINDMDIADDRIGASKVDEDDNATPSANDVTNPKWNQHLSFEYWLEKCTIIEVLLFVKKMFQHVQLKADQMQEFRALHQQHLEALQRPAAQQPQPAGRPQRAPPATAHLRRSARLRKGTSDSIEERVESESEWPSASIAQLSASAPLSSLFSAGSASSSTASHVLIPFQPSSNFITKYFCFQWQALLNEMTEHVFIACRYLFNRLCVMNRDSFISEAYRKASVYAKEYAASLMSLHVQTAQMCDVVRKCKVVHRLLVEHVQDLSETSLCCRSRSNSLSSSSSSAAIGMHRNVAAVDLDAEIQVKDRIRNKYEKYLDRSLFHVATLVKITQYEESLLKVRNWKSTRMLQQMMEQEVFSQLATSSPSLDSFPPSATDLLGSDALGDNEAGAEEDAVAWGAEFDIDGMKVQLPTASEMNKRVAILEYYRKYTKALAYSITDLFAHYRSRKVWVETVASKIYQQLGESYLMFVIMTELAEGTWSAASPRIEDVLKQCSTSTLQFALLAHEMYRAQRQQSVLDNDDNNQVGSFGVHESRFPPTRVLLINFYLNLSIYYISYVAQVAIFEEFQTHATVAVDRLHQQRQLELQLLRDCVDFQILAISSLLQNDFPQASFYAELAYILSFASHVTMLGEIDARFLGHLRDFEEGKLPLYDPKQYGDTNKSFSFKSSVEQGDKPLKLSSGSQLMAKLSLNRFMTFIELFQDNREVIGAEQQAGAPE